MTKERSAAIIPYEDGIILMQRIKKDTEYYTIPGGGREDGETIEETAKREILEELGIEIELTDKCYELVSLGRKEYFFVAKYISGEIGTGKGEEMTNADFEKYGIYIPKVVPKNEIKNINLLPKEIKEIIIKELC